MNNKISDTTPIPKRTAEGVIENAIVNLTSCADKIETAASWPLSDHELRIVMRECAGNIRFYTSGLVYAKTLAHLAQEGGENHD